MAPASAPRPRAASVVGRLLRRRPPVDRPSSAELASLSVKDRQELWDAHRQRPFQVATGLITSVAVLLSLGFTAFGLIYTARALRSTQEGQITDRYTKAIEQLASPAVDVRLGAIYALERLVVDSPRDRLTVRNVLAAFVRHRDFCGSNPPAAKCTARLRDLYDVRLTTQLSTDSYAALTTAMSLTREGDDLADLSQSRFPHVEFPLGEQLSRVNLRRSDLTLGSFAGANLAAADLTRACLTFADLSEANLSTATLGGADLNGAELAHADLSGADLRGADLRGVSGMTPDQIRQVAVTDENTRFGESVDHPQDCGPISSVGIVLHPR